MITAAELLQIPVFAGLEESECQRFAQKAADIRVEAGDWVIREGEDPRFFVVLEGLLQAVKDIVGNAGSLTWAPQIWSRCKHYPRVAWRVSIASSFRS